MINTNSKSLLVWDSDDVLSSEHRDTVLWQSYTLYNTDNEISIPLIVEANSDYLRSEYLALVYDLGETNINGKRVIDYLEVRPNFSYWWMTLLVEKCNFEKSPQLDNVIKLLAFNTFISLDGYSKITLVSSNTKLASAMCLLATNHNIDFKWNNVSTGVKAVSRLKYIYNLLPDFAKAIVWLVNYLIKRLPLKDVGVGNWIKTQAKTTFISYLFHLDPEYIIQNKYKSGYWTKLPDMLQQEKVQTNWLHIYVKSKDFPNAKTARDFINKINQEQIGSQNHVFLDSFIDMNIVWTTVRNWLKIVKLKKTVEKSIQTKSNYLWPLLKNDFNDSFLGETAMRNMLFYSLFEKAMSILPAQEMGCYLLENQGWEFGFINTWRSSNHGRRLIGIAHSTVRYWDLRYFFDPRSYNANDKYSMPIPDFIGTNGAMAKKMYLDSGFPVKKIVEVEALRFLHLNRENKRNVSSIEKERCKYTLLILGDYSEKNTIQQMQLLQNAVKDISVQIKYIVKSHPACPIVAKDYPDIQMLVSNEPLSRLIDLCTYVYTSCNTSAAVDAFCAGKQVITILDAKGLNMSPLRGNTSVIFVSTAEELSVALNNMSEVRELEDLEDEYFNLELKLTKWKKLLQVNNVALNTTNLEDVQ